MLEIPLTNEPAQSFTISLDGVLYSMRVIYNTRWAVWTLDVSSADFTVNGTALVGGTDIFKQHPGPLRNVYVVNVSGSSADATSDDLGTGIILVVLSDAEIEELV